MPDLLQWLCKNLLHQTMFAFSPFLPEKSIKSRQLNIVLGIAEIQKQNSGLLSGLPVSSFITYYLIGQP